MVCTVYQFMTRLGPVMFTVSVGKEHIISRYYKLYVCVCMGGGGVFV